jgi:hypothetical protein
MAVVGKSARQAALQAVQVLVFDRQMHYRACAL